MAGVVLVAMSALWWRLGSGPIELDVATPWLTAAIGENFGSNHSIEVGGTQIERDANGRTALRIRDIVVRDSDGTIVASAINFGDGSTVVQSASASHTYNAAGTYTITAMVTDNLGAATSKSATVVVTVPNRPPTAAISATPGSAYAPATVSASATGSSDPDGTIVSSIISFGDGTSASGLSASHSYSAAGVYTLTAKITDNAGASSSASTTVTVKAPEVIVSSPASGASVPLQVHVVASGFSGLPVTSMQVYVDSALVYTVASPNLDTTLALTTGTHTLIVKGWDTAGHSFAKSLTVTSANQPPVAALSVTSGSILIGGSIAASATGSSDPDGSIASTVISFGDGATASAVSASHQYKLAGTYTVKATVTDNLGASSTATTTVVVNPQFVAIRGSHLGDFIPPAGNPM